MKYRGGFLITRLSRVGNRVFEKILAERNISAFNGAQGRILYVLWQDNSISIGEISRQTGLAMTSLTSMLDRMQTAGLIQKVCAPDDRRKTLIVLTDQAKSLQDEYDTVSNHMREIMYRDFTKDEILRFENDLDRLLRNLEGT